MDNKWNSPSETQVYKDINWYAENIEGSDVLSIEICFREEFFVVCKVKVHRWESLGMHSDVSWYVVGDCVPLAFYGDEISNYSEALAIYVFQLEKWVLAATSKRLSHEDADFVKIHMKLDDSWVEYKHYDNQVQAWFRPRVNYIKWQVMKRLYDNIQHPELQANMKSQLGILD